ncbi:MAG: M16 family metallopeptidase [Bacteroidia bacterium]
MEYQFHTLSNGIRIVHHPYTSSEVAHCAVIINAGTRDEPEGKEGLAHFIEHLLFKGTKKRRSYHILSRMEIIGGELNAYTTKEETAIYSTFMSPYLDRALELIFDVVYNSTFPEKELGKEKEVVLDEIASYQDSPQEQIYDDFEEQVFRSHPLGKPILGITETVNSFNQKDIKEFILKNYQPHRIAISVAGNYPFEKVIKTVARYFDDIPAGVNNYRKPSPLNYIPMQKTVPKETYQAHCIMGNVAYNYGHPLRTTMALLNNILGGPGMNSRLNLSIREKYGFTYNIDSSYQPYSDTGVFSIYLGTDKKALDKTIKLVHKELLKLKEKKLGILQLRQAQQQIIGQIALGRESKASLMLSAGKYLLNFNKVDTLKEITSRIEAVTSENILAVANEVFETSKMSSLIFNSR